MNLQTELGRYFSFSAFRPGQEAIVKSILEGHDTLALLPTGGGKSLCYQLPALLLPGVALIVSPLIALMKNQVDALSARDIRATFLNSSISTKELKERIDEISNGSIKIVYIAPERFASSQFQALVTFLPVSLFAIDEAHCVSQWGHDFRPDYLTLTEQIRAFKKRPIVAAFTATATPEVKNDIVSRLNLRRPNIFVSGFDRPNLRFFARANLSEAKRMQETVRIITSFSGNGIVYVRTIKEAERMAEVLNGAGITSSSYHAKLEKDRRSRIQDEFMENKYNVIVATIAFGMGVDKADIRFVIHMGMPDSLESYYQEAGRAGRDGELAYCVLLHSGKDTSVHHFFINKSRQTMREQGKSYNEIRHIIDIKYGHLAAMLEYVASTRCRRKIILEYFGDPEAAKMQKSCGGCDTCLQYRWKEEEVFETNGESLLSRKSRQKQALSATVLESVRLYKEGYSPNQIAKMRNLGLGTIWEHLMKWYIEGGNLRVEELLSSSEEQEILHAMSVTDYTRLSQVKEKLPKISYEKIKLVYAKIARLTIR